MTKIISTHERGFTLVEMTVAIVIASIMMIALMATFILQSKAYQSTREVQQMQANARSALDNLEFMVMEAGFGLTSSVNYTTGNNLTDVPGQEGIDFNTSDPAYTCTQCMNNGTSDRLVFLSRDPSQLGFIAGTSSNGLYFTSQGVANPGFNLTAGNVVFILDANRINHVVMQLASNPVVTNIAGMQVTGITFSSTSSFYNEVSTWKIMSSQFNNGYIMPVNVYQVYIDQTNPLHPTLMLNINGINNGSASVNVPLAQDVEDFQLAFLMNNGTWLNGSNGWPVTVSQTQLVSDPSSNNSSNIKAIRIDIVTRTDTPLPNRIYEPILPLEDHTGTLPPPDGYMRRLYTLTINLPDLVPYKSILYTNDAL
ncbi:MAG: PilW family protein [bacterium]